MHSFVMREQSAQSVKPPSRTVRREALAHYALLYLMIALGDSFLYDRVLIRLCPIIAVVSLLLVISSRKTQYVFPVSILALGTLTMLFIRSTTDAMGPTELLTWMAMVCVTIVAVGFNTSKFLERLILLVAVLASFSVVIFLVSLVIPGIWGHISPISFPLSFGEGYWLDSTMFVPTSYYQAHGMFLYVDRGFDIERNVGIFREPAVYQVLLNSMIFVLLYMCPKALLSKRKLLIILYVATILTTQSATGYLLTCILLFLYALESSSRKRRIPPVLLVIFGLGMSALLIALLFGNSSWIADTIVGRFFSDEGFTIDTSGNARVGAATISMELMATHPLGCGYDVYLAALDTESTGYLAACLFRLFSVYGIPFGVAVVAWVFYPIFFKSNLPPLAKVSFVVMYFLATFFEDEIFYTTLIFIPVFYFFSAVRSAHCELGNKAVSIGGTLES